SHVTNNIFPLFLSQGWTLMYELFFYFVFSLFLGIGLGRRVLLTSLTLVAFHIVALYSNWFPDAFDWFFHDSVMMEFIVGMLLGLLYVRTRFRIKLLYAVALMLFAIVWFVYFQLNPYQGWGDRLVKYCVPLSLVFVSTVFWRGTDSVRFPKLLLTLGDASYSIYLTHTIIIILLAKLNGGGRLLSTAPLDLQFVATVLVALGVGVILYFLIENPFGKLSRKIVKGFSSYSSRA
ncbi:MAG: acyltransferase, partial [Cyanothece sp. SIO2G6]|nr:acyltransferase [Cyanothece sp. SIO2G6]